MNRIVLLLCGALAACATVHSGITGDALDARGGRRGDTSASGLKISVNETSLESVGPFSSYTVTLENRGDYWVRISRVVLDFGSPAANRLARVVAGKDLEQWEVAAEDVIALRLRKRQELRDALMGIAVASSAMGTAMSGQGAIVTGPNGVAVVSTPRKSAGLDALVVGMATLSVSDWGRQIDAGATVRGIPEKHLLAGAFAVPPQMFVRKWILLELPQTVRKSGVLTIGYKLERGGWEWARFRYAM